METIDVKIDYKLIGERIKNIRKSIGMTQETLAEKIDVATAFMSRVERGYAQINLKRLAQISTVLNVPIERIITGTTTKSDNYLDNELYEVLIKCTPEKQRLIYNIAKIVSVSNFV